MEDVNEPDGIEEVDAVPVLADEPRALQRTDAAAGIVVVKQAAAVAATSFAAGVVTVAAVRGARAVRARRRSRRKGGQIAPVLATRSFLIDVHLLGSRDCAPPLALAALRGVYCRIEGRGPGAARVPGAPPRADVVSR